MSLAYILKRVQSSSGTNAPELNPEQRSTLIDFINSAAKEVYEYQDLPVVLQEVMCNVTADFRVSLPPFVGEIRACRNRRYDGLVTLANIRARYTREDWPEKWNKFRIIGESPIANEVTNAAPLRYIYPISDPLVSISTVGITINSNRASETVTMNQALVNGTKSFIDITSISKSAPSDYNIVVQDSNGNELAIIYADQLDSRYLILDVSTYPNIRCCEDNYIMEVLFKPRLPKFVNDTDEFPLRGYDDVIVLKTKQLLTEEQEGKEDRALLMNEKGKELLKDMTYDKTGTVSARITTKRNGLFNIFPKWSNHYGRGYNYGNGPTE